MRIPRSGDRIRLRNDRTYIACRASGIEGDLFGTRLPPVTYPAGTEFRLQWVIYPPRDHGPRSDRRDERIVGMQLGNPREDRRPYRWWIGDPDEPTMTPERFHELYEFVDECRRAEADDMDGLTI